MPLLPRLLRAAALVALCASLGCAAASRRTVQGGVRGLVDETENGNLEKLAPDIYRVAKEATRGVVDGGVMALTEEERRREITEISEELGDQIVDIAGRTTEAIGKELREEIVGIVDDVLQRATEAGEDFHPAQTAATITRRVIDTSMARTAAGLDEHLGPALNTVLVRDLGPGVETVLRDDLGPGLTYVLEEQLGPAIKKVLGDMSPDIQDGVRLATKGAVLGVNDAVRELQAMKDSGDPALQGGLFGSFDKTVQEGRKAAEIALWVLLALSVLGLVVVAFLWARARTQEKQRREQAKRANDSLVLVAQAIREANEQDANNLAAYRQAIKRLGQMPHNGEAYAELHRVLGKRTDLRLPKDQAA